MQMVVLSRVVVDEDPVELTARGVTTLVQILSSTDGTAVIHSGITPLHRV